jgi:hypothetical protein
MSLTSSCANCGQAKATANYADPYCPRCTQADNEAQQGFAAENPTASLSDILYVGRMARQQFAIRPGSNYINPRDFSASRRAGGGVDNRLPGDRGNPTT